MAMRQSSRKKKDSDDEAEGDTPQTRRQLELESAETIKDEEISPAAFVFDNVNQQDDLNLFEEK